MRMTPRAASSRVDAELFADGRHRRLGRLHVGDDFAAAEIIPVDPAEPEIGVGRRRLFAAAAIGGRPRNRARRLRADMQLAEIVDPGDRAAAVADLNEIDHGNHDRVAGGSAVALDPVVGLDRDLAVLDQRTFGRGAADVERQHIQLAYQLAELRRAPEAGRRARLHHRDRNFRHRLQRVDAAIRLHDVRAFPEALLLQALIEAGQITLRDRLHIGREHGRVGAFIFAPLAGDLVRGHRRDAGPQFLRSLRAPPSRERDWRRNAGSRSRPPARHRP